MNIVLRDFFCARYRLVRIRFDQSFALDKKRDPQKPCGMYADIGGHCLGLFGAGGKLCMQIDGRAFDVDPASIRVAWQQRGRSNHLDIIDSRPKGIEFHVDYSVTAVPVDVSWPETEEDVDFGLWLFNVINSDERRSILTKSYQTADHL